MLGAIIGDIAGSRFEWNNHKSKDFELFSRLCMPTDDSVMTLAIAKALLLCGGDHTRLSEQAVSCMQTLGRKYPYCGYGTMFNKWLNSNDPKPYNSYGNGAAMRVSPCSYFADSLDKVKELSRAVTVVTHNHPEGLKGAEATAVAVWLAKNGSDKAHIRKVITENYYPLDFTLDEIRDGYRFNETCQQTVPQAIEAFLESDGFEDAVRCAISIGGDSDTLAAITGGIAEAYYGIPAGIRAKAEGFLDDHLLEILHEAEKTTE